MKNYLALLRIAFVLVAPGQLFSQSDFQIKKLKFPPFNKMEQRMVHFQHCYFNQVIVQDNRFDTAFIGIEQNGDKMPQAFKYENPLNIEAEKYLNEVIENIGGENHTLLISIRQFRKWNNPESIIQKTKKNGELTYFNKTTYGQYLFVADLYLDTGFQSFRKFLTLDFASSPNFVSLLNNIINATSFFNKEDSIIKKQNELKHLQKAFTIENGYIPSDDFNAYDPQIIRKMAAVIWDTFPVNKYEIPLNGIYRSFTDFRDLQLSKDHYHIHYHLQKEVLILDQFKDYNENRILSPYVIADSSHLYVHVTDSIYLLLNNCYNSYCFTIPDQLPDLYHIFSAKEQFYHNKGSYIPYGNNLWANLITAVVVAGTETAISQSRHNRILKEKNQFIGRNASIDMYSGDFIY
jgi:hypothetical protein